jgi:cation:H+ antiporter
MIIYTILFLALGFVCLLIGAKLIVISLENIAKQLGISQILVGLTILAIGTSLPEIAVSVMGGIDKYTGIDPNIDGIVVGNLIGSFFTQITLILGILGCSQSIFISKWELRRVGIMLFISLFIFFLCAIDGILSRIDALIMIVVYILYLLFIIKSEKKREEAEGEIRAFIAKREGLDADFFKATDKAIEIPPMRKNVVFLIIGIIILLVGAEITLLSGHILAKELNLSDNVIGILIIGLGTSLPELVADFTALRRGSDGIAIGDILGSNICDILLATGTGAIIAEFKVPMVILFFDIPMLFIAIGLVYYFLWSNNTLKRWEAAVLISFYGFYVLLKLLFFQI